MSLRESAASVELEGVRRFFAGSLPVIDGFSLKIKPGEFISLLGPSGCGKSTLLRLIAGLDEPDGGRVSARASSRGFVFQEAQLLPWRSVLSNTSLPLELLREPQEASLVKAREALARVGLEEHLEKFPSQLSGGMKMRVSVARALVSEPNLLLLDEPFSALDEPTRFHLQEDLRELSQKLGMTTVFVTHSVSEAVFLSDRAVVLSARPARTLLDARIELPEPRTAETRATPEFAREVLRFTQAYQSDALTRRRK